MTPQAYTCDLGVRIWTVLEIIGHFLFTTSYGGGMIVTNLLFHYIRMLSCKFQLFWPSSSLEEIFKMAYQPQLYIFWLPPLWNGPNPLFEQTWIPFTQKWFVLSLTLFEIVQLVLEKKIFFFFNFQCISILLLLSPLGWGHCPSFGQFWMPNP
jgi:hypothetical protein